MWGCPPSKYEGPWDPGTPLSVHPCPRPVTFTQAKKHTGRSLTRIIVGSNGTARDPVRHNPGFRHFPWAFLERGGVDFGKISSGWQIILLRHTGDFQKTVLLNFA